MQTVRELPVVEVEARDETGKNACRRLRARDRIPANVYGLDVGPFKVAVSPRALELLLRQESGLNTVFQLQMADGSSKRAAIIKELQRDPVTDDPIHVDFLRVDLDQTLQVRIPVHLLGTATGVKNEGGLMDFVHREVEVECVASNIPQFLEVDVSELHVNQHVSVGDLAAIEGVRVLDDPEQIVAVVAAPRLEAAEEEEEAEAAEAVEGEEEPEVAKKGKEADSEEDEQES